MTLVAEKPAQDEAFAAMEKRLSGAGLPWLAALRRKAIARFLEKGFPVKSPAGWKFTDPAPLVQAALPAETPAVLPSAEQVRASTLAALPGPHLVFVGGRFAATLSSVPEGAMVRDLASGLGGAEAVLGKADGAGGAFLDLNTAFFQDGALLDLPRGARLEEPIHLVFITAAGMSCPRVIIRLAAGASACVVEEYVSCGDAAGLTNAVTEVLLGEDARLEHIKLQREGAGALHVSALNVRQGRGSAFTGHVVTLGGAVTRNDLHVLLEAEGAECRLNGLYISSGRQQVDNQTVVEHAKPHGISRELYKGVLDGQARAVFNGLIHVLKDAQKTDANVYNKNLLLSEQGLIDSNPEFKINANDVQCRHGATIGQLSSDALFYLRSRGIGAEEAKQLLVYAFASEMVDRLGVAALKDALSGWLQGRLT